MKTVPVVDGSVGHVICLVKGTQSKGARIDNKVISQADGSC
jgi:hypothetical protein